MPTDSEKVLSELKYAEFVALAKDILSFAGGEERLEVELASALVHADTILASRTERVAALTDALTEIARIVHAPRSYGYDITHSARVQELTKPFHDGKLPKPGGFTKAMEETK